MGAVDLIKEANNSTVESMYYDFMNMVLSQRMEVGAAWKEIILPVVEKINSLQQQKAEIFESLDRLEYCSPKSEAWIKNNAKFLRQKLSAVL